MLVAVNECVERNVQKERLIYVVLFDNADRFVADQRRCVTFVAVVMVIAMPIVSAIALVREIIEGTIVVTILRIETASRWKVLGLKMSQVPLAAHRSLITHFLECLR